MTGKWILPVMCGPLLQDTAYTRITLEEAEGRCIRNCPGCNLVKRDNGKCGDGWGNEPTIVKREGEVTNPRR